MPIRCAMSGTCAMHAMSAAALIATVGWTTSAQAQSDEGVRRVLLSQTLTAQSINLLEITDDGVVYVEATGLVRSSSLTEVAAIYAVAPPAKPSPWIELTDGQRFTGWPTEGATSDDDIFWDSPVFGSMRLSLDDVKMVVLDPQSPIDTSSENTDDRVVLRNGDVLSGFIEHLGDTIGISTGTGEVRIPLDRLALAQFANDPKDREGTFIWIAGGTLARVTSLQTNRSTIEVTRLITQENTEANDVADKHLFPLDSLRAIVPAAQTLHPLASLTLTDQSVPPTRRWTPAPYFGPHRKRTLDAAEIEIQGPMRLEWSLPQNSRLLAFDAVLPVRSHMWGDCDVVVHAIVAGEEIQISRSHLSGDSPRASVVTEFPAGATGISITLDIGRFGPAQDEVILQSAIVLTDPDQSP